MTKIPDNTGTWADFGVKATSLLQPVIRVTVTGNGFAWGNGSAIVSEANTGPNYEISEDLSMVKGAHQLGFGGSYLHMQNAYHAGKNGDGTMTFNGQTTGLGLADFLMGKRRFVEAGQPLNLLQPRALYRSSTRRTRGK